MGIFDKLQKELQELKELEGRYKDTDFHYWIQEEEGEDDLFFFWSDEYGEDSDKYMELEEILCNKMKLSSAMENCVELPFNPEDGGPKTREDAQEIFKYLGIRQVPDPN